jgi:hypothetical protein
VQAIVDAILPDGIGLAGQRAGILGVDTGARPPGVAKGTFLIARRPAKPVWNYLSQEFPDRAHLTLLYALPGATLEAPVWFHPFYNRTPDVKALALHISIHKTVAGFGFSAT